MSGAPEEDDAEFDFRDDEWHGRWQDNPRRHAWIERRRARNREKHPPVDCWIDGVGTVELYQGGARRAAVERKQALITFYAGDGTVEGELIYLRSENPYDVAEQHLGIERVPEVRDESNEAEVYFTSQPRELEQSRVDSFGQQRTSDDELFSYLRDAARGIADEMTDAGGDIAALEQVLAALLGAATEAVLRRYDTALQRVNEAIDLLVPIESKLLVGPAALANARRGAVAISRAEDSTMKWDMD